MLRVTPYDALALARETNVPTPPPPLLAMMGGNVAPSPMMGGNVAPRPPPPIVRRQPLPTWYMQLGRTRPLLLNKTPFPSRTPPAAFMLPNPPIHWLAPSPAGAAEASSYTNWTYNDEGEEEEEFGFKKQYIDFK